MDRLELKSQGFMPGLFHRRTPTGNSSTSSTGKDKMRGPQASRVFKRMPPVVRNHFVAMVAEFIGTFLFLFLAFAATNIANDVKSNNTDTTTLPQGPNPAQLLYIALAFGFSLAVTVWIFYRVSGGLFNPAVTLGLCLVGAVPFDRGLFVSIAQILGAMASAGVVKALFPGPLAVTTALSGGTNKAQGLFIEMFLTAFLILTVFFLAVEKHKGTFLAPIGIGLALFNAELAGVYYTGGSLNPARSFGPCVANRSFPKEHWIYWVGPFLGALVASGFFWFIKSCEYETVNPGQDFDDLEASAFNPEEDTTRPTIAPSHMRNPSHENDPESGQERLFSPVQSPSVDGTTEGRDILDRNKSLTT